MLYHYVQMNVNDFVTNCNAFSNSVIYSSKINAQFLLNAIYFVQIQLNKTQMVDYM